MKKIFILLIILLFLTSCTETAVIETPIPSEISESVKFNEDFINRYCYEALENEKAYCGYIEDSNNLKGHDISWLSEKMMLDGSETYYEDLYMEAVINDDEILFPVNRKFCEDIKSQSVQMYAGLWCACYKLNDEAFYFDINKAFNHFDKDSQLRLSSGPYYSETLSGIAFGDTKIYELIQSGEKSKPYPSAYLYFPANADYLRDRETSEEWIEHYYLIADIKYDNVENIYDYSLVIEYTETEKGYFVTITPSGIDELNLPSEITDYNHVVAHGYILK